MADIVQANHDALKTMATKFAAQSQAISQMQQAVARSYQPLRNGAWMGRGSEAFFREMDSDILPAVKRLIEALAQADQVTRQISDLLRQADEEASSPFKQRDGSGGGDGGSGGGGDASGGGSDASGGGSDASGGGGGGRNTLPPQSGGGSGDFAPANDPSIQSMLQDLVQRFDDLLGGDAGGTGSGFSGGSSFTPEPGSFGDPTTWQGGDPFSSGGFGSGYDDNGLPYNLQGGLQPSWSDPASGSGSAFDPTTRPFQHVDDAGNLTGTGGGGGGTSGGGMSGGGSDSGSGSTPDYFTRPFDYASDGSTDYGMSGSLGQGKPFDYTGEFGFNTAGDLADSSTAASGGSDSGMGGGSGGGMGGGEPATTAPADASKGETPATSPTSGGGGSGGAQTAPATSVQSPLGRGIGGMASGFAAASGSDGAAAAAAQQAQIRFSGGGSGGQETAAGQTVRVVQGGTGGGVSTEAQGNSAAPLGLAALSPFAALLGKVIKDKTDKK